MGCLLYLPRDKNNEADDLQGWREGGERIQGNRVMEGIISDAMLHKRINKDVSHCVF